MAAGVSCPPIGSAGFRAIDPLDDMRGEPIIGTWQLVIEDDFAFDGGVLFAWSISALVNDIPLYYTNFAPGNLPEFAPISDSVLNTISTSVTNPLLRSGRVARMGCP